jgi:predicted GIY-YIG superfamily endonuclease
VTSQPVVYRAYDIDDRLIYIGCTTNFPSRMAAHRVTAWWAPLATRFAVEVHLDIETARRAETAAIHLEAPAFNQTHNQRRFNEPMPLTESDIEAARDFAARGHSAYLPYPLRWIRDELPA